MTKQHVLVVDDEKDICELVSYNLMKNGFRVSTAMSGEEALQKARADVPDLLVLDLMLPGLDGLDICRILMNDPRTVHIPIIMLSARGDEADIVTGLELGADDYVTKPFSPRVLLARVRAVLRKRVRSSEAGEDAVLKRHSLLIDPGKREVRVGDTRIELTFTEFTILHVLAKRPGWVFTRDQIIDKVRGDDYPVTARSVDVQIVGLRRKLGVCGKYIETVRGVGYRFGE